MLPKVPTIITLISVIPFVLLSIIISFNAVGDVHAILELLISYAAIMLSFLAGTRWGMAVDHHDVHDRLANHLYMFSMLMVLLAWLVLLVPDYLTQLLCLTVLFTIAWGVDFILHNKKILPLWFFTLRSIVTPIVIVSLYTGYFSII